MTLPTPAQMEANARLVNEQLVDLAVELIGAVHDGGPTQVNDVIARVPDGRNDALNVVLAAMCDPARTPQEMLAWTEPRGKTIRRHRNPREHGTLRGYRQHQAPHDPPCPPCRAAHAEDRGGRRRDPKAA